MPQNKNKNKTQGKFGANTNKHIAGFIGQNYSPTKFGFRLGNVDFALVLLTLCVKLASDL
jgi:hypothetical protein